ncbi:MAG: DUF2249 domain-containing protein [Halobacteriota archaeon]
MAVHIDLRDGDGDPAEALERALDDATAGEPFRVVADGDLDPLLLRYQLDRGRRLEWEHADPDTEPREHLVTPGEPFGEGEGPAIDVRDLIPQRRHQVLLETIDDLGVGEGFVLINDHDPKPLYHELRSLYGETFEWSYESRGSDGWRVAIERTEESTADAVDVVTRFDVRDIPKAERHPTIHHRYGMIPENESMELVAPHEPEHLRLEFVERYGDAFEWNVLEQEPGRCLVRITKRAASDGEGDADLAVVDELDVRTLPPAQRHELIFQAYDALEPGSAFVLVNDHDPKPLYHQFDAEAGPAFHWEYRQREPGEFRVLIGKAPVTEERGASPF